MVCKREEGDVVVGKGGVKEGGGGCDMEERGL